MKNSTITLNGVVYNQETGEAIGSNPNRPPQPRSVTKPAHSIHSSTQRSKTLSRRYVQTVQAKPANQTQSSTKLAINQATVRKSVERSPQITKFAKHPVDVIPSNRQTSHRAAPTIHPLVQKVEAKRAEQKAQTTARSIQPSDVIKREAIDNALTNSSSQAHKRVRSPRPVKNRSQGFFKRFATFASAGAALVLVAGYFTYLNMPNLSVRVAAAQAGIDASYPGYHPNGYSLKGPVAYNHGEVSMTFGSNGGPDKFKLVQSKTGWDSSAVLDRYVSPKAGDNYTTSRDSGLTIYTFGDSAAWVNNGILYTIEGDAPLSISQVRRMATSL